MQIEFFTITMGGKRDRGRVQLREQIYVTGLPCYLHLATIENYFERVGKIKVNKKGEKSVKLFFKDKDKTKNFEGRCKVTYEDEAIARKAVELLDGEDYKNLGYILKVSIALVYCDEKHGNEIKDGDWLCKFCNENKLKRINFEWQKTCFNCNRERDVCEDTNHYNEVVVNGDDNAINPNPNIHIEQSDHGDDDTAAVFSPLRPIETLLQAKAQANDPKPAKVMVEVSSAKVPNLELLEREMEDVLLNTFMNHDLFSKNFPLKVKIDVSNIITAESLSKDYNKKIHVELNVGSGISQKPRVHRGQKGPLSPDVIKIEDSCDEEDVVEMKPAPGLDISYDDITDTDSQGNTTTESVEDAGPLTLETNPGLPRSPLKRKMDHNIEEDQQNSKKITVDEKVDFKNLSTEVLIPPGAVVEKVQAVDNGTDKVKKNFTLEQDKEILGKVIELLPGKSLPDLELPDPILKLLSVKLSRCEISIQQRWKYSLRAWLVQFYAKTHRSWSKNLSKKASVQRRKDVSVYFNKLVKKNSLNIEVMNATVKLK